SEVAQWVEDGPDLKTDGVARWRGADLRDRIAAKFHVRLHERSAGKLLKKLNFSSMSVRPAHPQSGLAAQQAFKKRARIGGPPVAVETGRAILNPRGAAEKFLVNLTP
ncbi:MAG: helix-turn-helix domain-containing protein, partial [Pseudomonadota bacterium]